MSGTSETRLDAVDRVLVAGLRRLPAVRGKATVGLAWKQLRERRRALDGAWELRLADGSHVSLPRGSRMTWTVAASGGWDQHVIALVERYVSAQTLVLDVGASLGLWSLPLGRVARTRESSLWAFEPDPQNVAWLAANVERNGLGDIVEVHPCALGARAGEAQLAHREHGGGNAALRDGALPGSLAVPVVALDTLDIPRRISFMKLDVEGFELEVLRGARATVERDRPVIYGEFSSVWLRERGEDLPAYLQSLAAIGYETYVVDGRRSAVWRPRDVARLRQLDPASVAGEENLLLVPGRVSA